MKIKIKELALSIATLGPIGHLPFGAQIATFLTFPLLILLGWIYALNTTFFYGIIALLGTLAILSTALALRLETDQHPGVIVINNMLGMLLAFICIPITIKFVFIGFLLFNGAKYLVPMLTRKVSCQSYEQCPLFLTLLFVNVIAGLMVNTFLQFVLWLAD